MEIKRTDSDLFDLISDKHDSGHKLMQQKWNEQSDMELSMTDWFMLHLLNDGNSTAAEMSKHLEITRQATHKLINKLQGLGLVDASFPENNKRIKIVSLTRFGKECYNKKKSLKIKLENQLKEKIGVDQFTLLKNILASDWTLDEKDEVK